MDCSFSAFPLMPLLCVPGIGLCAEEIHVCGESAAINFVTELMYTTGEEVEVSLASLLNISVFGF